MSKELPVASKEDPIESAMFGMMKFGDMAKDWCCVCTAPTRQTATGTTKVSSGRAIMNARRGRSLTRQNLSRLIDLLRKRAFRAGILGNNDSSNRFTAHDLRALFIGKGGNVKFHPIDEYPTFYSEQAPNIVVTYRWDMCLLSELPLFMDELEKWCDCTKDTTFWIDAFFVDQNQRDLDEELDKIVEVIRFADYHAVFMKYRALFSGWCSFEVAVRTKRVMDATRLTPDDIAREVISLDDHAFSKLIMVPSVPAMYEDLFDHSRDLFETMTTAEALDKIKLQDRILALFGSKDRFNQTMQGFKRAAVERYKRTHPIDAVIRHAAFGDMWT